MTRIAVIGSGTVGQVLADGFLKHGFEVMRASREPEKLEGWRKSAGSKATTGDLPTAARAAGIVVLAVRGSAAAEALDLCGHDALAGKIIIDVTNPITDDPPTDGVLSFFTNLDESLMEALQRRVRGARFVKAFSCVGSGLMVNPSLPGGPPTMFICGNDQAAKTEVVRILTLFGWEAEDLGSARAARAIEPLCILWCIPGFTRGEWSHAFKLLKQA